VLGVTAGDVCDGGCQNLGSWTDPLRKHATAVAVLEALRDVPLNGKMIRLSGSITMEGARLIDSILKGAGGCAAHPNGSSSANVGYIFR
jgi:uncharacterized Zn-binding protein involved in type VI secretion